LLVTDKSTKVAYIMHFFISDLINEMARWKMQ